MTTISTSKVVVTPMLDGQQVAGWVTSTQTESDGVVLYGPFPTWSDAVAWGEKLINAVVYPFYAPTTNRG